MKRLEPPRSLALCILGVVAVGSTAAGAATLHRLAVASATGSGGAAAYVQSQPTGSALVGEVASSPNENLKIPFGVLGEYDASASTFGIGVAGISTSGYGVAAESLNSANPTMLAESLGTGDGLDAVVPENAAASGASRSALYASNAGIGNAIQADAIGNDAVDASASQTGSSGVAATASSRAGWAVFVSTTTDGAQGVHVESQSGDAVVARSTSGTANLPAMLLEAYKSPTNILAVYTANAAGRYTPLRFEYPSRNYSGNVSNPSGGSDLFVDGDLYVGGVAYGACSQFTASHCLASSNGFAEARVEAASRQVVDVGEAALVRGHARVRFDPRFASLISKTRRYLVFVSPSGESRGLYVENKTASGFDVRENHGGRASVDVDYRVVAFPRGDRSARLPSMNRARTYAAPWLAHVRAQDAADAAYAAASTARTPQRFFTPLVTAR